MFRRYGECPFLTDRIACWVSSVGLALVLVVHTLFSVLGARCSVDDGHSSRDILNCVTERFPLGRLSVYLALGLALLLAMLVIS